MPVHELFGGAITIALSGDYMDASEFRQVPDNQEVLLARDSNESIIVEVLQQTAAQTDADAMDKAVRFHFDSLANDNDATDVRVTWTDAPASNAPANATPRPATIQGSQRVKKFGKIQEEDTVQIWMAVWRIASKNVDLVLSLNVPHDTDIEARTEQFRHAVGSLRIVDFALFA